MITPADFFSHEEMLEGLLDGLDHVWDGVGRIAPYIAATLRGNVADIPRSDTLVSATTTLANGARVSAGAFLSGDDIELGPDAVVEPGAMIAGPAIIGPRTVVRHGAYLRGNVLTGADCIIGHATEVKNSALLGRSIAAHFAYIGDSLLGAVNLGAGTKLANVKLVETDIMIRIDRTSCNTGRKKFGAVMGDGCRTGCNSTTAPGTVMARNVLLYPNTSAGGYYPPQSVVKPRPHRS